MLLHRLDGLKDGKDAHEQYEQRPGVWKKGNQKPKASLSPQAAFGILSQELYGPACPFERANDLTLSICCHATGIVKVRGHGLFWGRPLPELADALQLQVQPTCFSLRTSIPKPRGQILT